MANRCGGNCGVGPIALHCNPAFMGGVCRPHVRCGSQTADSRLYNPVRGCHLKPAARQAEGKRWCPRLSHAPPPLSCCSCAGHFSPLNDNPLELKEGDLVKM